MTFPQVYDLFDHWSEHPPLNETGEIFLRVYTTWRGSEGQKPTTPEEHQKSLERRWKMGALNVKQLFEATGGLLANPGSMNAQGGQSFDPSKPPGIGPFPGMVH